MNRSDWRSRSTRPGGETGRGWASPSGDRESPAGHIENRPGRQPFRELSAASDQSPGRGSYVGSPMETGPGGTTTVAGPVTSPNMSRTAPRQAVGHARTMTRNNARLAGMIVTGQGCRHTQLFRKCRVIRGDWMMSTPGERNCDIFSGTGNNTIPLIRRESGFRSHAHPQRPGRNRRIADTTTTLDQVA